ncbi:MAG: hypothetical protein NTU98_00190 [Bacteroidetes bacterium]|nr:hypothetical protein [Bacteroidota bacterium]
MKNINILPVLLILASIMIMQGCKPKIPPTSGPTVTFEAKIPDLQNQTFNTYTVSEKARINPEQARILARKLLDISGEARNFDLEKPVVENEKMWWLKHKKDPSASLKINLQNGDISLNNGTMAYMEKKSTPDLLKEDAAVKMANSWMEKMGYKLDDKSLVLAHVGGANMGNYDQKEGAKVYEKFTTVRYDRILDNIPVLGHSRIIVMMAEKGKLQQMIANWAPLQSAEVKKERVVIQDDLKGSIEKHLIGDNAGAKNITVKTINLVYYDDGSGILEPALHALCEVQIPKGKNDTTLITVKHDLVEPILKDAKMMYTFQAVKRDIVPKQADTTNMKEELIKGRDERK